MEKVLKKKLLILTQWFDPEPALKGLSFCKEIKNFNLAKRLFLNLNSFNKMLFNK